MEIDQTEQRLIAAGAIFSAVLMISLFLSLAAPIGRLLGQKGLNMMMVCVKISWQAQIMAHDNDFVIPAKSLSSTPIGDRDPDSTEAVWIRSLRGHDNSSGLPRTLAWQDGVVLKPAQTRRRDFSHFDLDKDHIARYTLGKLAFPHWRRGLPTATVRDGGLFTDEDAYGLRVGQQREGSIPVATRR